MIPRTLVPWNARPAESSSAEPQRTVTALDERTLIPAYFVRGPLEERTSIPASLPLESIAARLVVPRDLPVKPLEVPAATRSSAHRAADARIAIPADAAPPVIALRAPAPPETLPEVVDPDIFTTGSVHLLASPEEPRVPRTFRENTISRASSVVFHVLLITFILLEPRLFPARPHAQDELEISRHSLGMVFLPDTLRAPIAVPRPPAEPRSSQIHVDPRALREIAPNVPPLPAPGKPEPERLAKNLPDAPVPHVSDTFPDQPQPQPRVSRPVPRLESPDEQLRPQGLILPKMPSRPTLAPPERGGVQSSPIHVTPDRLSNGIQILTPTEGVDFTSYITRLQASVERNWYPIIPESVRLGERGVVVLDVRIMRDGSLALGDPRLVRPSGRSHLDSAAISAIRASNPYEPLPSAFSGPFVEFRFLFLYNVAISELQ